MTCRFSPKVQGRQVRVEEGVKNRLSHSDWMCPLDLVLSGDVKPAVGSMSRDRFGHHLVVFKAKSPKEIIVY